MTALMNAMVDKSHSQTPPRLPFEDAHYAGKPEQLSGVGVILCKEYRQLCDGPGFGTRETR